MTTEKWDKTGRKVVVLALSALSRSGLHEEVPGLKNQTRGLFECGLGFQKKKKKKKREESNFTEKKPGRHDLSLHVQG